MYQVINHFRVSSVQLNSVSHLTTRRRIEWRELKKTGCSRPVTIATPAVSSSPGASSLDYNFRRMRSSTAIPQSSSSTFYIDTPPLDVPFKLGDKLRQPTVQTTMAASHSPKLSRRKPRSETVSVLDSNKSSWVTRYQPGVLLLSGSMRECLIQRKLQESENEFCEQKKLKWVNNLVPRLWPHPVSVRGIHCWRILCVQCNRLCVNCSTHS